MFEINYDDIWEELSPEYFEEDERLEEQAREIEEDYLRKFQDLSSSLFYGNRYDD